MSEKLFHVFLKIFPILSKKGIRRVVVLWIKSKIQR